MYGFSSPVSSQKVLRREQFQLELEGATGIVWMSVDAITTSVKPELRRVWKNALRKDQPSVADLSFLPIIPLRNLSGTSGIGSIWRKSWDIVHTCHRMRSMLLIHESYAC